MINLHRSADRLGHWVAQQKPVQWLHRRYPAVYRFISYRFAWDSFMGIPLTGLLGLLVLNGMMFSEIAENVVNSESIVHIDQQVTLFLFAHRTSRVSQWLFSITYLASQPFSITITVLSCILLLIRKQFWKAVALACVMIGVGLSNYYGKLYFRRVRPLHVAYYELDSYSFPSGHSSTSMALYGFLTYLLVRHLKTFRQRLVITCLGVLLILIIGFSRIYLGAHFLSDVLGGYLVGAMWVTLGIIWVEWKQG